MRQGLQPPHLIAYALKRRSQSGRNAGMSRQFHRSVLCLLLLAVPVLGPAAEGLVLESGSHRIVFDATNGSLAGLFSGPESQPALRGGEQGLWELRFREGGTLQATSFHAGSPTRRFEGRREGDGLTLRYAAPEAVVVVKVTAASSGFDLTGTVQPASKTVLDLALPGRMRFDPAQVRRFVSPLHPHLGIGAAFNSNFFLPQPPDRPSSWQPKSSGSAGYARMFGGGLDMRDLAAPAIPIRATETGRQWFGSSLAQRLDAASAAVHRPSRRTQVDLVLIDSTNGPLFAASHLGGKGSLWRFGGQFEDRHRGLAGDAVMAVLQKSVIAMPARRKVALVNLRNGPDAGSFANLTVSQWRERWQALGESAKLEFTELRNAEQMLAAASGDDYLAILNPYGEWLPVPSASTLLGTVDVIGGYVKRGGNWFEVGGYTFYVALQPSKFLKYEQTYPPVFSDFLHLDSAMGAVSVFRIQPRTWKPWAGAADSAAIFVPGRLGFGGDERGGWCEHVFSTFVKPDERWVAPPVRLALGGTAEADLGTYCQVNGITRPLREKLAPEVFDKFRRAVLVKYDGNAREKLAALENLPVPSLIHYSDYLKGGFDKEYPDHLPPNPGFGTAAELRAFHDRAHAMGHLIMPYTNPTWWCDHPRGPSFERAGNAPLLLDLTGKPVYERYGKNDGWTTTMWHPAVRAANRETLRQFTQDFPVDILFQDQCGARGWRYDLNPASPTPYAYAEGMLSLVDEDAQTCPLGTEDGWDRVVNAEVQMCGFTFALGPDRRHEWAREMKTVYHLSTWELYPFAQRVAHDKTAMLHHDLGKFVTDRNSMAWTLGLGFAMSYRISSKGTSEPVRREWLKWVDRIQKSVCARYVGEPVAAFEHRQGTEALGDDGVIRATYGPVQLTANLSPGFRSEAGRELTGYGFLATASGLVAGNLRRLAGFDFGDEGASFVAEGGAKRWSIWFLSAPGGEAGAELPSAIDGEVTVTFDGQPAIKARVAAGALRVRAPGPFGATGVKHLWHAVVTSP